MFLLFIYTYTYILIETSIYIIVTFLQNDTSRFIHPYRYVSRIGPWYGVGNRPVFYDNRTWSVCAKYDSIAWHGIGQSVRYEHLAGRYQSVRLYCTIPVKLWWWFRPNWQWSPYLVVVVVAVIATEHDSQWLWMGWMRQWTMIFAVAGEIVVVMLLLKWQMKWS